MEGARAADDMGRVLGMKLAALAPHFEGHLKNSIAHQVLSESGTRAQVFAQVPYAKVVDQGRRPGKFPPVAPIRRWVELKLHQRSGSIRSNELDSVTYLVRRKIARKGTKATHYVDRGMSAAKGYVAGRIERLANLLEGIIQ